MRPTRSPGPAQPALFPLTWLAPLALVTVGACGGSEPESTTPANAPGADAGAPTVPAGTRTASAEVQALSRPSATDVLAVYADLEGAMKLDLARGLLPQVQQMVGAEAPEWKDCVTAMVSHAHELVVGGDGSDDGGSLVTLRLAAGSAHDALRTCAAAAGSAPAIAMNGADEGFGNADRATIRRGDVLVVGDPTAVKRLLDAKPVAWPADLALAPDVYLAAIGHGEGVTGRGQLTFTGTKLLGVADITLPDENTARGATQHTALLKGFTIPGLDAPTAGILKHVLDSAHVEQKGKTLSVIVDLEEGPADQARDIGGVASAAMFGVRQYITDSKKVEAISAVRYIGKSYATLWEGEPIDGKPTGKKLTKLHSFPAVPKEVPRGITYESKPADWKGWKELHFEIGEPQRYQYEIKAAKDGKSADIIARGDLDGDGKTSEIKLHVEVDPRTHSLQIPSLPTETDGNE